MPSPQIKGLNVFVRRECANAIGTDGACLIEGSCRVLAGQRCGYFEQIVLGPPDYPHRLPGYDYARLFAEYAQQTGAATQRVRQRHCGCGTPLRRRERLCAKCRRLNRKASYRKQRRSKSLVRHS